MAKVHVEGVGALAIEARDKDGNEVDTSVLQESGTAFDPSEMHLDLTKEEKRRTTALMMAIQAYSHLIIKDAEYLREVHTQERGGGLTIRPATMDAMIVGAIQFDAFISGRLTESTRVTREAIADGAEPVQTDNPNE